MRPLLALAIAALVAPAAAANHAVYIDESRVLSCLVMVDTGNALVGLNCDPVARTVAASEPAGGKYRLTATWVPVGMEWSQLQASLKSCDGACPPTGSGVCLNNNCIGDPGQGNIVQQGAALGGSPLVVEIPTAGNENNVTFVLKLPGPVATSLRSQQVDFRLEHVG